MKLLTALKAREVLLSIANTKIGVRTSYKIFRFIKAVDENGVPFYNEHHKKLLDKYATRAADGTPRITEDKIEAFNKEYDELMNIELANIPGVTFSLEELEEVKLSPREVAEMSDLIQAEAAHNESH